MPELFEIGERKIVSGLIEIFDPDSAYQLGDDCAILDMGRECLLMTTDMICQSTHIPESALPRDIGWYAAAINLSDIAAMGGHPLGMLFALGLPPETDSKWLDELAAGIKECCSKYGVPVLGGDTKENPNITITGTAFGTVPRSGLLRRSGARPGDIVAVTGQLGRGLFWERDRANASQLLRVEPRLKEGQMLSASGAVTSCMDISDGLSTSLHHLSRASNVGFAIDASSVPTVPGLSEKEKQLALHYGGDFELLFTIHPGRADKVLGPGMTRIGCVTDDRSILLESGGASEPLPDMGYQHFGVRE